MALSLEKILEKVLPMGVGAGLGFVLGILRSGICAHLAPHLDDKINCVIIPQLDQIKSAIDDLKLKDQKIAQDLFEDAINSLKIKFQMFSTSSAEDLKRHSDRVETELTEAQKCALAANHSGLKVTEKLNSSKWILVTELLRVLNEATSKAILEPADQKWIQRMVTLARQKCVKYLKKANEITELMDCLAEKIPVGGYKKTWGLKFTDRTDQVCQLLGINLYVSEFFRFMEDVYGAKSLPEIEGSRGEGMEEQTQLLGAMALVKDESMPLLMGMDVMDILRQLNRSFEEIDTSPQARFEYMKGMVNMLGLGMPALPQHRSPGALITSRQNKFNLQEVALMKNGGTVEASSGGEPADGFREGYHWESNRMNSNNCAAFIQRNLKASVTPHIFALGVSGANNIWRCGPKKFKLVVLGEEDEEWETLLDVKGLEWELGQESVWKYWLLPRRKSFQSFKVEISECVKLCHISIKFRLFC